MGKISALTNETNRIEMLHYQGTLDFECDFCDSNSYDNIHLIKGGILKFVICKECIDKVLEK